MKTNKTETRTLLIAAALVIFMAAIAGCGSSGQRQHSQQQQPPVQRVEVTHRYEPNTNDIFAQINEQQRYHWDEMDEEQQKRYERLDKSLSGITESMKRMPDMKILQGLGGPKIKSDNYTEWEW